MRTGVILAAGLSTRLPNKIFLPIDRLSICIESSIALCMRSNCDRIYIVVNNTGIVQEVLNMRSFVVHDKYPYHYVVQHEPRGVVDAIRLASKNIDHASDLIVAFADNVYGRLDYVPDFGDKRHSFASCRRLNTVRSEGLDRWDDVRKQWAPRGDLSPFCFSGWMFIKSYDRQELNENNDLIDFMNLASIAPFPGTDPWWDIGTVASYHAYLCLRKDS